MPTIEVDRCDPISTTLRVACSLCTGNYSKSYCSMFIHDGTLMVCGGSLNKHDVYYGDEPWKCFLLDNSTWKHHSTLNYKRSYSATVTTSKGTFIFGGNQSSKNYEYLPIGSKKWTRGKKNQLPGGFFFGCAIEVKSNQEIWLIDDKKILSFDVNSHSSQILPLKLIKERKRFACAKIPGTSKIIVTGGYTASDYESSCEIIDTETKTVTIASSMNYKRCGHGMGIIYVRGEDRLAVFGGTVGYGRTHNCLELFNIHTQKWELAENLTMRRYRASFGFVNIF